MSYTEQLLALLSPESKRRLLEQLERDRDAATFLQQLKNDPYIPKGYN